MDSPVSTWIEFHEWLPDGVTISKTVTSMHVLLVSHPTIGETIRPYDSDTSWPRIVARVNKVYEIEHIPACGSLPPQLLVHVLPR